MITTISNPTHLHLNKRCELFFNSQKHFAPMGHCSTKQLAGVLDSFSHIDLAVEFQASRDEKARAREVKTYTKRLNALPAYYSFTGFAPKVIDGHEMGTMTGRLTRCV